jgi:hypothetical protein
LRRRFATRHNDLVDPKVVDEDPCNLLIGAFDLVKTERLAEQPKQLGVAVEAGKARVQVLSSVEIHHQNGNLWKAAHKLSGSVFNPGL